MRSLLLALTLSFLGAEAFGYVDTTWVNRHDGPASGDDAGLAIALHPQGVAVGGYHATPTELGDFVTMLYDSRGELQWVSTYNGPSNGVDEVRALATDAAGNVYVAGPSQGDGTGYDFAAVKYNSAGVEQWVKRMDYEGNDDAPNALAVDHEGNVYVAGLGRGDATQEDWVTVKYAAGGAEQWRRFHDGDMYMLDEAFGIEFDAAGNVYVVGQSSFPGAYQLDYAVIKYSPDGDTLLVAEYDGGSYRFDNAYAMVLNDAGDFYVTGRSYGGASYDIVTVKYDTAGDRQWVSRFRGAGGRDDVGKDMVLLGNGDVVVAGYSTGDGTGFDLTAIRYRPNSDTVWARHYNGPANDDDFGASVAADPEGNIYVVGHSRDAGDTDDLIVVKFDGAGNRLQAERYDGPAHGADVGYGIAVSGSLDVYVTGKSAGSGTGDDFLTIRYGPPPGVEEEHGARMESVLWPTLIRASELARYAGRVLDVRGRHVTDQLRELSPGVYFHSPAPDGASGVRKVLVTR
jgi:hypothetical protein